MTPFIVLICNKKLKESSWDIFEIQTGNNVIYALAENIGLNFRIYKIFSYLLIFENFSSTKFMSAFASFRIINIFNVLSPVAQID